jgi:hypothetical protein
VPWEAVVNEEVQALFRARDEAVSKKDGAQFLSTQLLELPRGASESYLSVDDMKTEILSIQELSTDDLVVFVRETYSTPKRAQQSAYLLYFIIHATTGWKIYRSR